MRQEIKSFRYCARSLDTGKISIREAIRFEADPESNFIYAVYYNDWKDVVITEPIFKTINDEELYRLLSVISQFYHNNPEGLLDFVITEFNI